ncbi:hypothetical protein, partial [Anaerovibrio slackiae]|uniref:hypothetical protein n=1 Tax=Anaerovibrio slackiae TaxID=2652309 RepID=UPI003866A7CD
MKKKLDFEFDLQLFAEGGDDGAQGEIAGTGAETAAPAPEKSQEGESQGQPSQVQPPGKNQETLFGKTDTQAEA